MTAHQLKRHINFMTALQVKKRASIFCECWKALSRAVDFASVSCYKTKMII